jgi:hypothetical protein
MTPPVGMTKEKSNRSIESGCWTEAFFATLDGPKANDNPVPRQVGAGGMTIFVVDCSVLITTKEL